MGGCRENGGVVIFQDRRIVNCGGVGKIWECLNLEVSTKNSRQAKKVIKSQKGHPTIKFGGCSPFERVFNMHFLYLPLSLYQFLGGVDLKFRGVGRC